MATADGYRHKYQYEAPYRPGVVPVMLRGTLRMLTAERSANQTYSVTAKKSTFHPAAAIAC